MLRLRASDVAAAAGLNPYRSVTEVVIDSIQRLSKSSKQVEREKFATSVTESKKIIETLGTDDQKQEIEKLEKETKKTLTVAKSKRTKEINVLEKTKKSIQQTNKLSDQEKQEKFQEIEKMKQDVEKKFNEKVKKVDEEVKEITSTINQSVIQKNLQEAVDEKSVSGSKEAEQKVLEKLELPQMKELATRHVNTNRGINEEESILNTHEKNTGTQITQRNAAFYTLIVNDDIKIVGAIDGYSKEEGLVEVKNRRNRFLGMPEYEMVQCEVYMKMLKIENCVHIERFNGNDRATNYGHDPGLWEKVKYGLEQYREMYYEHLNN